MKKIIGYLVVLLIGIGIGFGLLQMMGPKDVSVSVAAEEPLYWVALMDASYRRDKPGKSPMGMDLVPVYAGQASGAGTVKVSPGVKHNLGIRTSLVRRGLMKDSLTTFAIVQYNEDLMVNVYPRVEGWIEKLFVKSEGEAVTEGQALYELYSPELINAQEEFLAALRQGNQILIRSARERLASLSVPESIVSGIEKHRKVQRSVTVYATQSGVVHRLEVREGNFVKPGNQILSIAGLASVWVTADVFESDVSEIGVGDSVSLKFDYLPGKIIQSTLDFIYPVVDSRVRTLRVRSTVDNADGSLRPNMFAKATIKLTDDKWTTLVPVEAIIRTGNQNRVVLVSGSGEYKSIAIDLGRVSRTEAEVLHGLNPGDEVVTHSQFLLDSESSITSDFKRMDLTPTQMEKSDSPGSEIDHSATGADNDQ
ncbi:MAG: efflux RND transporter periplasmic adaptor subunit [Gammaproteobacteria bacterium]|nr:efflux RND transporter periplasmic adaptor subunit [Gammaproteobacteria bacterium]